MTNDITYQDAAREEVSFVNERMNTFLRQVAYWAGCPVGLGNVNRRESGDVVNFSGAIRSAKETLGHFTWDCGFDGSEIFEYYGRGEGLLPYQLAFGVSRDCQGDISRNAEGASFFGSPVTGDMRRSEGPESFEVWKSADPGAALIEIVDLVYQPKVVEESPYVPLGVTVEGLPKVWESDAVKASEALNETNEYYDRLRKFEGFEFSFESPVLDKICDDNFGLFVYLCMTCSDDISPSHKQFKLIAGAKLYELLDEQALRVPCMYDVESVSSWEGKELEERAADFLKGRHGRYTRSGLPIVSKDTFLVYRKEYETRLEDAMNSGENIWRADTRAIREVNPGAGMFIDMSANCFDGFEDRELVRYALNGVYELLRRQAEANNLTELLE